MKYFCKFIAVILLFFGFATTCLCNSEDLLKKVSIMTPSPDIRSELWDPHFHFLFKHWPDLLDKHSYIPIYLASNLKQYKNFRVKNIMVGKEKSWSDDLKVALENVKTEFVILLNDDYIITQDVNTDRLAQIINFMELTNGAYAQLALNPILEDGPVADGIDDVIMRAKSCDYFKRALFNTIFHIKKAVFNVAKPEVLYGRYRTSLQSCIWRVEILKKLLVSGESPWEFEWSGSKRSESIKEPFYLVIKTPVFQYFQAVAQRKYHKSAIETINRLGFKFAPTLMPIME
jgi:hypothetical protein